MAYVKTVWQDGDIILPEKLNNMEYGIEANDQKQAVLYSAQTLTDAQKAQARENIGVNGGGASFDDIYPVGAFWWSTEAGSPAAQGLSAGTWEQIKDTFLLAAGDTYTAGNEGGSADAVVVAHNHILSTISSYKVWGGNGVYSNIPQPVSNSGYWTELGDLNTAITGVGGTGKNMPPYLAAYCWHRVA